MQLLLALLTSLLLPTQAFAKVGACELMIMPFLEAAIQIENSPCEDLPSAMYLREDEFLFPEVLKRIGELRCIELFPQLRNAATDPDLNLQSRIEAVVSLGKAHLPEDKDFLLNVRASIKVNQSEEQKNFADFVDRVLYSDFNVATSHRLFRHLGPNFLNMRDDQVLRFPKTGSRAYLIGGNTKVILKVISRSALKGWQRAFEAKDEWKAAGFDYIPVEPIVAIGKDIRKLFPSSHPIQRLIYDNFLRVAVLTEVLDGPPIDHIQARLPEYGDQQRRIMETLGKLNVLHGHPHDGNLVAVKDRLYIIDFDQARAH